ncbi:alanine racemase [Alkaliphilus peptidifermentans]|uniref:Alanine racemase n=1 Tax=Alkaliphilus peptidifermentans DSM 18978 TaxID=1120976 RepID=A0A1G5H9M6_9FIRM|nr:alanine racemase [Alkaliphilus peptidifermentans]SCY60486.1 alanine racemase [Alkaliphilus peptidifermentans DSM 18978]
MNPELLHRDTWVEIHLDKIENNVKELRKYLPPSTKLMAAVKADAYGHGDLQVSKIALRAGAEGLAVSILREALFLRRNGIEAPILVLTPILPSDVNLAIENDLSVTIFQSSWLKEMRKHKKDPRPLKVHIKIDTGLGRLGLRNIQELEEILPMLSTEDIFIEGMYTHFATANREDDSFFRRQFQLFSEVMEWAKDKGLEIQAYHCSNTAATLKYPECSLDIVRVGVGMFGIYPSKEIKRDTPISLETALSFHSRILHIKKVKKGSVVGYDTAYEAQEDEWIATIPVGYADGWYRCFQGFYLLVEGKKAPIVGKICMDQLMIKLPKKIPVGTQVTLIGKQQGEEITLEDLASHIESVPQEIPSMIGYRVPRVYYYNGKPVEVLTERIWQGEKCLV